MRMDFNPNLSQWVWPTDIIDPAGEKSIEHPTKIENLVWQSRSRTPTAYENALGDALEQVFEAGAVELADVVANLNERGFPSPENTLWTEESFARTIQSLGA